MATEKTSGRRSQTLGSSASSRSRRAGIFLPIELSAGIDLLFGDDDPSTPPETRIRRAADAGLRWVEMWGWVDRDLGAVARALGATGLRLNCLTLDPFVPLVDDRLRDPLLRSLHRSAQVAADLGCPYVVVLAGAELGGVPRSAQRQAVIDGLRRAATVAERYGVTLLLENLNNRTDVVGDHVATAADALAIVASVDHPSVRVLYDVYHSVIMGERPDAVLDGQVDLVGHVQVADVPGRHEPGTGCIDWSSALGWLSAQGYRGRLGLEYQPTVATPRSLDHLRAVIEHLER